MKWERALQGRGRMDVGHPRMWKQGVGGRDETHQYARSQLLSSNGCEISLWLLTSTQFCATCKGDTNNKKGDTPPEAVHNRVDPLELLLPYAEEGETFFLVLQ